MYSHAFVLSCFLSFHLVNSSVYVATYHKVSDVHYAHTQCTKHKAIVYHVRIITADKQYTLTRIFLLNMLLPLVTRTC